MKVRELIEKLRGTNPESEVFLDVHAGTLLQIHDLDSFDIEDVPWAGFTPEVHLVSND